MADAPHPVTLHVELPAQSSRLLNIPWIGLFIRYILCIPVFIVMALVGIGVYILLALQIPMWVILFTGRYPEGIARFLANYAQWGIRVGTYFLGLSDRYPGFFGTAQVSFAAAPPTPGGYPQQPQLPQAGYPQAPQAPQPGYPQAPQAGYPQAPQAPQPGYPQAPQAPQPGYPQAPQAGYPQAPQPGYPQAPQPGYPQAAPQAAPQVPQPGYPQPPQGGWTPKR